MPAYRLYGVEFWKMASNATAFKTSFEKQCPWPRNARARGRFLLDQDHI